MRQENMFFATSPLGILPVKRGATRRPSFPADSERIDLMRQVSGYCIRARLAMLRSDKIQNSGRTARSASMCRRTDDDCRALYRQSL